MQSPLILTVSQLNLYTKSVIEQDDNLNNVFVCGEISNFVDHYRSGHLYLSLKDEKCSISAVMFAGNASRLKFKPENGMSVIVRGRVSIYERDGKYQLYIDDMQPDGVGALALAFEQTKEKLAKLGIFSPEHKKTIPQFPSRIGVISSPTGAAIQDVLNVLNRRFPLAEIVFSGVQVQGDTAAEQICRAIEKINGLNAADVVIIARGGGSAEDLWPFNDEKLAYAIYNSHIPIISGVGHETDYTICDLAADLRAPTPSAAAELSVPDCREQLYFVSSLKNSIYNSVNSMIDDLNTGLNEILNKPVLENPNGFFDNCELYLDSLRKTVCDGTMKKYELLSAEFSHICEILHTLSPVKVLSRGYSIVKHNGCAVTSSKDLKSGDYVDITFANGTAKAKIVEVNCENDI